MNTLIEKILTDPTARQDSNLETLAAELAEAFAPWEQVAL